VTGRLQLFGLTGQWLRRRSQPAGETASAGIPVVPFQIDEGASDANKTLLY
jgi:hypothetical protein